MTIQFFNIKCISLLSVIKKTISILKLICNVCANEYILKLHIIISLTGSMHILPLNLQSM